MQAIAPKGSRHQIMLQQIRESLKDRVKNCNLKLSEKIAIARSQVKFR